MMGHYSFAHAAFTVAVSLAILWPLFRILRRTGHSGWWSLLALVPFANLVGLWVFAYARWPALDGTAAGEDDRVP